MPGYRQILSLPVHCAIAALCIGTSSSQAASFAGVVHDTTTDELVVTMVYRGTNPDHIFSLVWDECESRREHGTYEVAARVLDDQWMDAAREQFTKTVRFSLTDLDCRPAAVTLLTEPHFRVTIDIPAGR